MAEIRRKFRDQAKDSHGGVVPGKGQSGRVETVRGEVSLTDLGLALAGKVLPKYGNYGGPGTDVLSEKKPVDDLDRLFMYHDVGYTMHENKLADRVLSRDIRDMESRGELKKLGTYARVFGNAAKNWFKFTGGGYATDAERSSFYSRFKSPVVRNEIPAKIVEAATAPTDFVHSTLTNTTHSLVNNKRSEFVVTHMPKNVRSKSAGPSKQRSRSRSVGSRKVARSKSTGRSSLRGSNVQRQRALSRARPGPVGKGRRNPQRRGRTRGFSAPVYKWPGGFGENIHKVKKTKGDFSIEYFEDRIMDYSPTATTLATGTILTPGGLTLAFNPTNFYGCFRMQRVAALWAQYRVRYLMAEIKVKGNQNIQGGFVAYWDPDPNDDPADVSDGQTRLQIASNHKGNTEGAWNDGRTYWVIAPHKRDTFYCDTSTTEVLLNVSHRFCMIATPTAGLTTSCNLFTVILHCELEFMHPSVEPLFAQVVNLSFLYGQASTGLTAAIPFGSSTNSVTKTSGNAQLTYPVSTIYGDLPAGQISYWTTANSYFQFPKGRWYMLAEYAGTGITAATFTIASTYTTIRSNTSIVLASGLAAWHYCMIDVPSLASSSSGYVIVALTATTVTAAQIRFMQVESSLTRPPSTKKMSMGKRLEILEQQASRCVCRLDTDEKEPATPHNSPVVVSSRHPLSNDDYFPPNNFLGRRL